MDADLSSLGDLSMNVNVITLIIILRTRKYCILHILKKKRRKRVYMMTSYEE